LLGDEWMHPTPSKYDAGETLGERFALLVEERDGLEKLFQAFINEEKFFDPRDWWNREQLISAADELRAAGLLSASEIIFAKTKTRPSMVDPIYCEDAYDLRLTPGQRQGNIESWLRFAHKRLAAWEAKRRKKDSK